MSFFIIFVSFCLFLHTFLPFYLFYLPFLSLLVMLLSCFDHESLVLSADAAPFWSLFMKTPDIAKVRHITHHLFL